MLSKVDSILSGLRDSSVGTISIVVDLLQDIPPVGANFNSGRIF